MVGTRKNSLFTVLCYLFFICFALVTLYPIWSVLVGSLTPYNDYVKMTFKLWPENFTFEAYEIFFKQEAFLIPLKNTLIYAILGSGLSILVTTMAAYALSRKQLAGRKLFMYMFFVTMLFSGGIVPVYITMKGYNLADTIWALILVELVDVVYLIILRTQFQSIPVSIEESARLDGAGDIKILFRIMLPMAKPTLATITLFYLVYKWGDFFNPLYLIRSPENQVLQVVLYNIIHVGTQNPMKNSFSLISNSQTNTESLKMAAIIAVTFPILVVYPFLQKHFAKGVMMGSIKE